MSMMYLGLTLANLLGVPLGTFLGHNLSWRYAFILVAATGALTWLSLRLWMPFLPKDNPHNLRTQLGFFFRKEAWLIMWATAIGTGGFFCWYSYIAPLLTEESGFSPVHVPYIMALAGAGMCIGNLIGGKLADRYSHVKLCALFLAGMMISLLAVYFLAEYRAAMLMSTLITGALVMMLSAPIQMLMIQTAKGAETLASAALQACFNIGNALGAFLGGLPLVMGYSYASPQLVGMLMAGLGLMAIVMLLRMKNHQPPSQK